MCWFHTQRTLIDELKKVDNKKVESAVLDDIDLLQSCPSKDMFIEAFKAFDAKYIKTKELDSFRQYFKKQWIDDEVYNGWYEGYDDGCSTNNGLEATNNVLKTGKLLRQRLSVSLFLRITCEKIIKDWSHDRDETNINCKPVAIVPSISTSDMTSAYQWNKLDVKIVAKPADKNIENIIW